MKLKKNKEIDIRVLSKSQNVPPVPCLLQIKHTLNNKNENLYKISVRQDKSN